MTREEAIEVYNGLINTKIKEAFEFFAPELAESEDEKIRKELIAFFRDDLRGDYWHDLEVCGILAWLEKKKENPKSADSIPADCTANAKCENSWHKVGDSLPDNGRLVLAQDCLGNTLLARYDGEGNWEVSVYDNDDYYCRNTITKWCEIPSEKQKEQKPWKVGANAYFTPEQKPEEVDESTKRLNDNWMKQYFDEQKPAEWSEEDEDMINSCISSIEEAKENRYAYKETDGDTSYDHEIAWLNSLRPSWKPSEEQMEAFRSYIKDFREKAEAAVGGWNNFDVMIRLFEQLKKLGVKEEPEYYQHFDPDC